MAQRLKTEFQSGPNSIPQTIKIVANPALVDPTKTDGRSLRRLLLDIVDTLFAIYDNLTGNIIRGIDQKVRDLTRRDAIKAQYLVIGQRCYVTNNATAADALAGIDNGGAEYYLLRDSSGPLIAFIDADQGTVDTQAGRWVLTTGTKAQIFATYPVFVAQNQVIQIGDIKRYTSPTDHIERLFQAKTKQPLAGNGANNVAPSGAANDPNWIPFAPIQASLKPRIYLTLADAQNLLATSAVAIGQPYVIDFGPDAKGYSQLLLTSGGEDSDNFATIGELRVNGVTTGIYSGNVNLGVLALYAAGGGTQKFKKDEVANGSPAGDLLAQLQWLASNSSGGGGSYLVPLAYTTDVADYYDHARTITDIIVRRGVSSLQVQIGINAAFQTLTLPLAAPIAVAANTDLTWRVGSYSAGNNTGLVYVAYV